MRAPIAILALGLSISAASAAELSQRYDACMSNAMNTRQMVECATAEAELQDQALTVAYHDAMARQSSAGREHLRNAQRAWIKLRERTCRPDTSSGSIAAVEVRICFAQENAKRAAVLQRY